MGRTKSDVDVGFSGQSVEVGSLNFKFVRLFDERAEVRREVRLKVAAGTSEFQFFRFPLNVEKDTIRVETKAKAAIRYTILDDKEERTIKPSRARKLSKDIKLMRRNLIVKGMHEAHVKAQKRIWTTAAGNIKGARATGVPDSGATRAFAEAFVEEMDKLNAEEVKLGAESAKIQSKMGKAEKRFEEANRCQTRLTINFEAKEAESVEMEVIYYVNFSGWTAAYDVRLDTHKMKMKIGYFAMIKQRSGEDWVGAKLQVSSGSGGAGRMPLQRGLFVVKKMNPDETGFTAPERSVNVTFEIPGRKRITADGAEHKVLVSEIELDPDIQYFVIPKESLTAFIKGKAVLKSAYTLLPGPVSVFRDSLFVSKNMMKRLVCPKEDFMCALGPEPSVRVEYATQESQEPKNDKLRRTTESRITVKNKGKAKLKLTVLEQVPISRDTSKDGVRVAVIKPNLDSAKSRTGATASLNRFNYLEWTLDLSPDDGKTLETKYCIEFPASEDICFQ